MRSEVFSELGLHEFLVASANDTVDHLSVLENEKRRDGGDIESHGDALILIGVQLAESNLTLKLLGKLLDYRGQAPARPAPTAAPAASRAAARPVAALAGWPTPAPSAAARV